MSINPTHIHLLLNHVPTVGFVVGLAFFVMSLFLRQAEMQRASLVIFFLVAAVTIATYISGNDAREALKETQGISNPLIEAHEGAALVAFVFMQITGFFSWIGLWIWNRPLRYARWNTTLILIFATLAFVLMARAAYFGGAIRHPETGAAESITIDSTVPALARSWGNFVQDHSWVWPTCETLHFVGLCMLFGTVWILNLRLLGIGKSTLTAAALQQLLPLGMLGFGLNLITGMMFFVATPEQYTGFLFFLKMMLVIAGALNLLWFMLGNPLGGKGTNSQISMKLLAVSAIVIWLGVVFCGHMLPWLGNSF